MDNKLKRAPGVYLAGFMGSGKSTVARLLADRLGWDFIDLDTEIETAEQVSHDCAVFRNSRRARIPPHRNRSPEERHAQGRSRGMPTVIALGGGSFVQPVNKALLDGHGISVWLDCSFETIQARIIEADFATAGARRRTIPGSVRGALATRTGWPLTASMPPTAKWNWR